MATITGNSVYADPTQWWTLDYTFANSKFTWSVTAHASFTSYWNSIYGLTVNIGGNSYYKGDIDWRNYTPNTVVYSGTTNLSDCTVQNGVVTLSVSGNFYYGTWSADYRSSGSGTCAVDPPTVATLSTPSITNQYSGMTVAGRSVITFRMKGTSQTGSTTMSYSLYQDGSVISTSTGTSGQNKDVTVTAPSAGSHTYKYTATDGNGTTSTSGNLSLTTYAYTPPSFTSVSAVRWTTGNSSGTASDTGTYARCIGNFTQGKVGTTALTTTLTVSFIANGTNYSSTTTATGTALYMGAGNVDPDNSYTVTFGLKDTYVTTTSVTRTDTLTQGGRGIDLIYSYGRYGVGVGEKAVANQFRVNLPTYIQNIPFGNTGIPDQTGWATGGTVTSAVQRLYSGQGTIHGLGSYNKFKLATITMTGQYCDETTSFFIQGRYCPLGKVTIRFNPGNASTYEAYPAYCYTDIPYEYSQFYLYHESTTVWALYAQCPINNYGSYNIRYICQGTYTKPKVTVVNEAVSSIPSTNDRYWVVYRPTEANLYDTNLRVIGTYYDGTNTRYVYRRRVTGTSTSGSYQINISSWGLKRVLDVRFWDSNSGNGDHAFGGYYMSSADYLNWYINSALTTLYLRAGTSFAYGAFELFIDYTY